MTMHLAHPALSLNGKRKGKMKFKSAEAKREYERLQAEWEELKQRHGVKTEERKRKQAMTAEVWKPEPTNYRGRNSLPPSLNGGRDMSPAVLKPAPVYTGTKMLGIGTMHKSNSVPIFSSDEAKDISTMRRN